MGHISSKYVAVFFLAAAVPLLPGDAYRAKLD
jgi:hypothetical protein